MFVKVPYERFEQLLRAEIMLELERQEEKDSNIQKFNKQIESDKERDKKVQTIPDTQSRINAERVIKDMVMFLVKRAMRKGDYYYIDNVPMGGVRNGNLVVRNWTLDKIKSGYSEVNSLNIDIEGTEIIKRQKDGKYLKQILVPKRVTGSKQVNMRCWVIDNKALEEWKIFDEVFKKEKMDRDKFMEGFKVNHA